MTDRETVIVELTDGIEILSDFDAQEYTFRERQQLHGSVIAAIQDALELLKVYEPDETRLVRRYSRPNVYADLWLHCEKCGGRVDNRYKPKFCPECGRKVKWDG